MNDLAKAIADRTGIPEAQAQQAAEVAINFIKERLPEPYASQIDNLIAGKGMAGGADDLMKGIGGMLGGKK